MDGEIGVSSEFGSGSLFWFSVRFGRPGLAESSRHVYGAHALVVSSDESFCDSVSRFVESWGMPALCAQDAEQGLNLVLAREAGGKLEADRSWIAILDRDARAVSVDVLCASPLFGAERVISIGQGGQLAKPISQSRLFDQIAIALGPGERVRRSSGLAPAVKPLGGNANVLIVEDNASLQEILVHQFAALGISAKVAGDGSEAVEAVGRERFSLVLMDCHMPNMDGFAATRAIRAAEAIDGGHVAIVAMTANAFKEDREACLAAGMDDYLSKPVRIADLRAMTQRWIGAAPG